MTDSISFTWEQAITKKQNELNDTLREFNQWATKSPQELTPDNEKFQKFKQDIKLLRVTIKEYTNSNSNFIALPKS